MSNEPLESIKDIQELSSRKIAVLLVDDQRIVAEGVRRMLEPEQDIEFYYCGDPSNAIKMAIENDISIILQDLVMPDVDGFTLLRFYRANVNTKDIPVIVLSSREDPKIKSDAFNNGANDYLVKLPDKIELIARIRAHSRSYMARMERDAAFYALREMQKQLEETNKKLEKLSHQDGLTGLANRRSFDEALERECKRAHRDGHELSLLMIDIDHFKLYNDTYGHQAGDDCIKYVANVLSDTANRPADVAARYGGEEFSVILPSTPIEGAKTVAEKIRASVEEANIEHTASPDYDQVTISVGIASLTPDDGICAKDLISMSDKALYCSKEQGRNRVSSNR
ncbi:MAG: PleD family two-component system response regulator [Gammaproteobacteria bacterium]|nr:MAG: PleD family two-component system response regulator [Gammaproteobacteria bacterium]